MKVDLFPHRQNFTHPQQQEEKGEEKVETVKVDSFLHRQNFTHQQQKRREKTRRGGEDGGKTINFLPSKSPIKKSHNISRSSETAPKVGGP